MALEVYAVAHAEPKRDRDGRFRGRYGPDRPDGYHLSEKAAEAAVERWKTRYPHHRWRVAMLVEA